MDFFARIALGSSLVFLAPNRVKLDVNLARVSKLQCYLDVIDIAASGDNCIKLEEVRKISELSAALSRLPAQHPQAVRVYIDEIHDNDDFQRHLNDLYGLPGQDKSAFVHGTGFTTLSSQWKLHNPMKWFLLNGYHFYRSTNSSNPWDDIDTESRLKGAAQLFRELLHGPESQWARTRRRIILRHGNDGLLSVLISCKTLVSRQGKSQARRGDKLDSSETPFSVTGWFVTELLRLNETYGKIRGEQNWRQVFLLQYQHANLNLFGEFLEEFTDGYVNSRRQDFDPRSSKLRQWVMKEMAADSYYYRQLTDIGNELAETVESLLEVAKASLSSPEEAHPGQEAEFLALEADLRGCCRYVRGRLERLTEEMENSLKFLDLARNMSQTNNVQFLTIIATFFLPLSLAAGVLSMQSRFKDLGMLLYDFFGVGVLLGFLSFLFLGAMVCRNLFLEQGTRLMRDRIVKRLWKTVAGIIGLGILVFGALVLTSFLVGMFDDVVLGAKILGYGFVAAIGGPVAIAVMASVAISSIQLIASALSKVRDMIQNSWRTRGPKQKQKGPEGSLEEAIPRNIKQEDNMNEQGNKDQQDGILGEKILGDNAVEDTSHEVEEVQN